MKGFDDEEEKKNNLNTSCDTLSNKTSTEKFGTGYFALFGKRFRFIDLNHKNHESLIALFVD